MNTPMHLDLPTVLDRRVLEKRYRREGHIVVFVALVGFALAVCCGYVSDIVGSALKADIHPSIPLVLGVITLVWSAIMYCAHYLRSPEDLTEETDDGIWDRRAAYRGGH